jgi:hypothetical protein
VVVSSLPAILGEERTVRRRIRGQTIGLVAFATVLLLASTPTQGATTGYTGTFATGGKLSFDLKRKGGKRLVKRWRWTDFPLTCDGTPQTTSSWYEFSLKARKRRFQGGAVLRRDGEIIGGARVAGEFARGYVTATGTFRVWGRTPEKYENCESKKVGWTASKTLTTPPPEGEP